MEMEHERSMAQATHLSMLHDDDVLASNIEDQPIYQAYEFSQAKEDDEVKRCEIDQKFVEDSLILSPQSSCLASLQPKPSPVQFVYADDASAEDAYCMDEQKGDEDKDENEDEEVLTAPTRSSTGISSFSDLSVFSQPFPETNSDFLCSPAVSQKKGEAVVSLTPEPKSEKTALKITPHAIRKVRQAKKRIQKTSEDTRDHK